MAAIPKFKIGLYPFSNFRNNLSIPEYYWKSKMNADLIIYSILKGEYSRLGKWDENVYYNFERTDYGWREEFVYSPYNHLPDELFDI